MASEDVVLVGTSPSDWAPGKERPSSFSYKAHPDVKSGGEFISPPVDKKGKIAPEWGDIGLISNKTSAKSYVWLCHWCGEVYTGIPARIKFHLGLVRIRSFIHSFSCMSSQCSPPFNR